MENEKPLGKDYQLSELSITRDLNVILGFLPTQLAGFTELMVVLFLLEIWDPRIGPK